MVQTDAPTLTLSSGESFTLHFPEAPPAIPQYKIAASICRSIIICLVRLPLSILWLIAMSFPQFRDSYLSTKFSRVNKLADVEVGLLSGVSGRVVDVGSGGGVYLRHCQNATHVVAVEPNTMLHSSIRENGKTLKGLTIVNDLKDIAADASAALTFDWVILGTVLCSVRDLKSTVNLVDSLLKPGGKIYFYEHIGFPKGSWKRRVQDLMNPLRRHARGGCNCNRDSLIELQKLRHEMIYWEFRGRKDQVLAGTAVMGLILKRQQQPVVCAESTCEYEVQYRKIDYLIDL